MLKHSRRGAVAPFMVMDVMQHAAELEAAGRHVVHMEVGQPGTPAPRAVRERARELLMHEALGYTVALGIPELRARIARHYTDYYGVDLDPARVAVCAGSSAAFHLAFLAVFEAGDRVAMARPCYPSYRHILEALGLEVVFLDSTPENGYQPTVAQLEAVAPIDGVMVASPSNPVGSMLAPQDLASLCCYCEEQGIRLISDEIYHGLVYEKPDATAAAYSAQAISINSFSKYFSMTGWRLGWAVLPPDLVRQWECLAQNFFICPSAVAQYAAVVAFDCHDELEAMRQVYAHNRRLLLDALPSLGFDRLAPADGAFYLYADVSHLTDDSLRFSREVLDTCGVALTSGRDFDPLDGHRFLRFSYARSSDDIALGLERLRTWSQER